MIIVEGLTKLYGSLAAISDLSFRIEDNEVVGFLGLNGAGKSTVLRILAGSLIPTDGSVHMDGEDLLDGDNRLRKLIGFLPEVPPLYWEMTVLDYLGFIGGLRGLEGAGLKRRIGEVLDITHTKKVSSRLIHTLSHGYQQRVGVAQAIIHEPRFLILDEPNNGLDPAQIVEMREMIHGLKDTCTVLVSSHILSEISQTCDRILVIQSGSIIARGTEEDLAKTLGSGGVNVHVEAVGSRDSFEKAVRSVDGVNDIIRLEDDGKTVKADVNMSVDVTEKIASSLIGAGMGLRALGSRDMELESVFLKLTNREDAS